MGMKKTKKTKTKTWRKWTNEEKEALQKAFCHNISQGVGAQKIEVVKAQKNFPILEGRLIQHICSQVNNLIKKRKKEANC